MAFEGKKNTLMDLSNFDKFLSLVPYIDLPNKSSYNAEQGPLRVRRRTTEDKHD